MLEVGHGIPAGAGMTRNDLARVQNEDELLDEASDDDVKAMSFEQALAELEQIVAKLEGGKAALAESIAIYERGEALKSHCETLLKQAEARIEKITLKNGAATGTEPLDA